MRDSTTEWNTDMLVTFGILKSHQIHNREDSSRRVLFLDPRVANGHDMVCKMSKNISKMPSEIQDCIKNMLGIPQEVYRIVTVTMKGRRCILLELRPHPHCTTVVYDTSSNRSPEELQQWEVYQNKLLTRFGLHGKLKWHVRYYKQQSDFSRVIPIKEDDDYDSGPIALRFLWERLCPNEFNSTRDEPNDQRSGRIRESVEDCRIRGVAELKSLIKEYEDDMYVKSIVEKTDTERSNVTLNILTEDNTTKDDMYVKDTDEQTRVEHKNNTWNEIDEQTQTGHKNVSRDIITEDETTTDVVEIVCDPQLGRTDLEREDVIFVEHSVESIMSSPTCRTTDVEGTSYRVAYPYIPCPTCDTYQINGRAKLAIAENAYYDCFMYGNLWWKADMVSTFGFLKGHEVHRSDMIYVDAGTPGISNRSKVVKLPPTVTSIVTVAMQGRHFAVMQLKLYPDCTTIVYDGMSNHAEHELLKWEQHEAYVMARYGIDRNRSGRKWIIRHYKAGSDFRRRLDITQRNLYDCGPIASRVLWELFCPGQFDEMCGSKNVEDWRKLCIDELRRMLERHFGNMVVRKRKRKRDVEDEENVE
jgi:hypothetical protein